MLKRPDNNNSLIALMALFLIGLAMIMIPVIQQRQEIDADNNIYAMIAEEIQHQQAAAINSGATKPGEPENSPLLPEDISETEAPPRENTETDSASVPDDLLDPVPEDYPSFLTEADILPETEADDSFILVGTNEPEESAESPLPASLIPQTTVSPSPTKRPDAAATNPPVSSNQDYVAWISIPGTVINYPVVRSDRSEYYLHHLITGQQSKLGCLFSLTTSDYQKPSQNIAIYGHHLSNSTAMFSTLMDYKSKAYWESHPTIELNTIYGMRNYKIFAVLNHTVSDWDASTASFTDGKAFLRFVNRAKEKSFYDTGITVSEEDHIITLITCDRSFGGVQGRLLVMGVEQ